MNKNSYFRIHIVANSDSIQDQLLKYTISDKVEKYISTLFKGKAADKENSKAIIEENIQNILEICSEEVSLANLDYDVYANIREYVL